jgi:hypothetical protein
VLQQYNSNPGAVLKLLRVLECILFFLDDRRWDKDPAMLARIIGPSAVHLREVRSGCHPVLADGAWAQTLPCWDTHAAMLGVHPAVLAGPLACPWCSCRRCAVAVTTAQGAAVCDC